MSYDLLAAEIITLALALWLGLYLLSRASTNQSMRFAGFGLTVYALALVAGLLSECAPDSNTAWMIAKLGWPLLFLPAMFWFGAIFFLLPEEDSQRKQFGPGIRRGLVPFSLLIYTIASGTDLILTVEDKNLEMGPLFTFFAALVILLLTSGLALIIRALAAKKQKQPLGVIVAATIFFGLGLGLLLLPLTEIPEWFLIVGVGFDLILLGVAIAFLDAFDLGENLAPDIFRSLFLTSFAVLLFGGQVALAMAFSTGVTFAMLFLLLASIASATAVTVFLDPVQSALDGLVFGRLPRVRMVRANSRLVSAAAPRSPDILDPESLEEGQFTKLTRRALSDMGHLPRLSTSPLTRMAIVSQRLIEQNESDNTLERAAELKSLLRESIGRMRPSSDSNFGTTDEWRHYNALYFPYVVGLKPYSLRTDYSDLDQETRDALDWFRSQVPERTLYNWQNAAAALVAQDLREQNNALN